MKLVLALVLVVVAAAVESKIAVHKKSEPTSADVEALLDPTVQSLPKGQHKLTYKSATGQEQCVVCQPFQGCGCRDVVAIRCELKRLKQKLLRLKRIAHPHKRSHHGRDEKPAVHHDDKPAAHHVDKPAVKVAKPVVVKPTVKIGVVKPLIKPLIAPKPEVHADPKPVAHTEVKPLIKVAVQPAVQPAVLADPKPVSHTKVKPVEHHEPLVKLAVQPAILPAVHVL